MTDFVAEYTGQLGFVEFGEQGIGDKDLSPGQGKGVDGLFIGKEVKFVLVRGFAGDTVFDKGLSDLIYNGLELFVTV